MMAAEAASSRPRAGGEAVRFESFSMVQSVSRAAPAAKRVALRAHIDSPAKSDRAYLLEPDGFGH
jgi:hypothetical protein